MPSKSPEPTPTPALSPDLQALGGITGAGHRALASDPNSGPVRKQPALYPPRHLPSQGLSLLFESTGPGASTDQVKFLAFTRIHFVAWDKRYNSL